MGALNQLAAEFPAELEIVALECMAACDDVPAVMIEIEYHPQVAPRELLELVRHEIAAQQKASQPS